MRVTGQAQCLASSRHFMNGSLAFPSPSFNRWFQSLTQVPALLTSGDTTVLCILCSSGGHRESMRKGQMAKIVSCHCRGSSVLGEGTGPCHSRAVSKGPLLEMTLKPRPHRGWVVITTRVLCLGHPARESLGWSLPDILLLQPLPSGQPNKDPTFAFR